MKKILQITEIIFIGFGVLLFSGCSLSGGGSAGMGGVLKSVDGGIKWEAKVKAGEKTIAGLDVLTLEIDPSDSRIIYLGTLNDGIFKTSDGGENWEKIDFPPIKVYGLAIDPYNSNVIYASGVWQKRGKIYKSQNQGIDWEEIYTEPADGTVITSLAIVEDKIYAGTSEGMIFRSDNGGESWQNLKEAPKAVTEIRADYFNGQIIYFEIFNQGLLRTKDGGVSFDDLGVNMGGKFKKSQVFSLAVDPNNSGVVYAGTGGGVLKSSDFGDNWEELNVLESSKKFPTHSISISPQNDKKIIYSSAQAIYISGDGGNQWSTFQLDVAKKSISSIIFDPSNPEIIYATMRSIKK